MNFKSELAVYEALFSMYVKEYFYDTCWII